MLWRFTATCMAGWLTLAASTLAAQDQVDKGRAPPSLGPNNQALGGDAFQTPCVSTSKLCVPVPGVKVHTTVVYGCKTVDYCLPKSGGIFGRCHDSCPSANCENSARTKRVLLKKVVTQECPETKCEPRVFSK